MRIFLEPNDEEDRNTVPYLAQVEITTAGAEEAYAKFRIPVHWYHLRDRSVYRVEVCGFQLDAHTSDEIPPGLEKLLPALVYLARLPTYVFVARHSRYLYPVYTIGDEVIATTRGGPHFRHVELAKVREYLTDYLWSIGELWAPGNKDRLHVRGVHSESLGLVRPVFYLKKRVQHPQDNEFWAPVFPSDDGDSIYTYAANAKREEVVNLIGNAWQLSLRHCPVNWFTATSGLKYIKIRKIGWQSSIATTMKTGSASTLAETLMICGTAPLTILFGAA